MRTHASQPASQLASWLARRTHSDRRCVSARNRVYVLHRARAAFNVKR